MDIFLGAVAFRFAFGDIGFFSYSLIRIRSLSDRNQEVPYGTNPEEAYGKIDHGFNLNREVYNPIPQEVQKTSTRQYFGPDMALLTEMGP